MTSAPFIETNSTRKNSDSCVIEYMARGGQKQRRKILRLYGGVASDGAIAGEHCYTGEGEDWHGLAEIGQLG
jgi:hypothetical protein